MGSSNRKGRDIDSALRKKGFLRDTSGDHIFYIFGSRKIRTRMSHGMLGSSIGTGLIGDMATQLHLSKGQFLALIDCTLDADGYREIIENLDGTT
jgi:hypothetical protein